MSRLAISGGSHLTTGRAILSNVTSVVVVNTLPDSTLSKATLLALQIFVSKVTARFAMAFASVSFSRSRPGITPSWSYLASSNNFCNILSFINLSSLPFTFHSMIPRSICIRPSKSFLIATVNTGINTRYMMRRTLARGLLDISNYHVIRMPERYEIFKSFGRQS